MKAVPVEINWHTGMPIFASEKFLKSVGDEYGWLGGFDAAEELCCVLPYTILHKAMLRMVRFRIETIPTDGVLDIQAEKSFLNSVVDYFRTVGVDLIIPASNNAIFRTFPDGADAAPYGSYVVDLRQPEHIIWQQIHKKMCQNILTARKNGIVVQDDTDHLKNGYELIRDTFKKSNLPFISYRSLERFVRGLSENCRLMTANYQGGIQSYIIFAYSNYCAYAVYGGSINEQQPGAIKLLCWEAMRAFKQLGVQRFDFYGTRIKPEDGSKQAGISSFKQRFGAQLKSGYMWKYSFNSVKYSLYTVLSRLRSGGDIVDAERHKLIDFNSESNISQFQV
ncbi:peptidoglycan bridge formation glycyltransferase FemA/FemB family protein [candidate division KSB1 bacterium]|nr:peptidoglycan bridge formation glycyltransferase FemA/FemB family protein [candidate division KSB1 bacterium]